MRWATVVESSFRVLVKQGESTSTVMQRAIKKLSSPGVRDQGARLLAFDWDSEVPVFTSWVSEVLTREPLPDEVTGLWFSVPEIDLNNEARLHFIGSRAFDEGDWASDSIWPAGACMPEQFLSDLLTQTQELLDPGPGEADDASHDLLCGIPLLYTACLLRHSLPKVDRSLTLGRRELRGIGFGFASGDMFLAGVLTRDGWKDGTARGA